MRKARASGCNMVNENDKKIKALLSATEAKRKELGTKPKPVWKTNGVIESTNINTINSTDKCVVLASRLMLEMSSTRDACEFLGVPLKGSEHAGYLKDALDDLKLRAQIVLWEAKKKELQTLEKRLKDLRSSDAKTEDALADISKLLG